MVVLQFRGLTGVGGSLTTPLRNNISRYEMLYRASCFAGSCERGNEHLRSIKGGEFFD
jgi:hypothetical protein